MNTVHTNDDDGDIQSERIESISDCAQHIKPVFIEHCINTIQAIGHKIRDLRKAKVGKHMAYDKFLKMTEGDWRKSRYAFVISSLKTSLFEISSCIEDALSCIDKLGCITAEMRGLRNLYCEGKVLDLNRQDNFDCLQIPNDKSDVSDSSIVKQRSDAWHKIRNTAHVTGSTCNKALGLETLKKQQMHYKQVFNEEHVTESPSKELQMRFDYGTANEINCVATLTGKVLPVFYEQSSYFEEGCYTCRNGFTETMPTVIVSPDGSIRNNNGQIILAVEIKCPYPGKTFTTPVQYAIPKYYIPQILCEMAVLKTDKLIFLSYSQKVLQC
ncbi:unnamed protein product [Mytilus edulis]|uniref:YqaJ viral recombinase domain-containing protein n=1 Tax=Mytilus edulis TaxID=6550 RepID=A0A8S3UYY7_MYTED|nr:unnamed protein product [Mytilus edulis]